MSARQLWVPGELWVETEDDPGQLVRGPLAAWWTDHEDVRQWKMTSCYVVRAELADRAAMPHPRSLLRDEHRYLRELLARTPILEVPASVPIEALGDATVYTIGFARNADDMFQVSVTRGKQTLASVAGASINIEIAAGVRDEDSDDDPLDIMRHSLHDRILRAVSGGAVDGTSISLAGYWHGVCAGGQPLPVERELALREAMLAEIAADAESTRQTARAIVARLGDADEVEVPHFGRACRTHLPARTLVHEGDGELEASVHIGEDATTLAIPAEDVWHVGDVEPWMPLSLATLHDEHGAAMQAKLSRPKSWFKRWLGSARD